MTKKLLLCSSLSSIEEGKFSEDKILYIHYSFEGEEKLNRKKNELISAGFKNVDFCDLVFLDKEEIVNKITNAVNICIAGGNTFSLQKLFFEKIGKDFVSNEIRNKQIIIGVSAGAHILSKTVFLALIADKNITETKDFSGLEIFNGYIKPHLNDTEEEKIIIYSSIAKSLGTEKFYNIGEEEYLFFQYDK